MAFMASGSYNGAGIQVPDLLLYGALGVAAYFIYKSVVKPTSEITGTVGDVAQSTGKVVSSGENALTTFFDGLSDAFKKDFANYGKNTGSKDVATPFIPIGKDNWVTSVQRNNVFGTIPVETVTTSAGQSMTVPVVPNTYYSDLGIGFDALGQGYSKAPTATSSPKQSTGVNLSSSKSNTNKSTLGSWLSTPTISVPSTSKQTSSGNSSAPKSNPLDAFTKKTPW